MTDDYILIEGSPFFFYFVWTIVGLKRKKEMHESEIEKLGSIREMQTKESDTSGKVTGLERKIQYAEIEKVHGLC